MTDIKLGTDVALPTFLPPGLTVRSGDLTEQVGRMFLVSRRETRGWGLLMGVDLLAAGLPATS